MGTFHQIAVGVVCVAGAFLFGHFLNNQTPPEKPHPLASSTNGPIAESKLILPKANDQGSSLPQFRTRSSLDFEFEQDLPPPSELGTREINIAQNIAQGGENPRSIRDSSTNDHEIEVPDFSALAAQFKGTALELPSAGKEILPTAMVQKGPDNTQNPTIGSGIDLPNPTVQPEIETPSSSNKLRDLRQQTSKFEAQPTALPIDLPNEIGPATTPLSHDSLTPEKIEQTFAADAFAPKLKGNYFDQQAVRRFEGVAETSGQQQPFGSSILESSQSNGSPNAIVSYNDPFPEPEVSGNEPGKFHPSTMADRRLQIANDSQQLDTEAGGWTDRNRNRTTPSNPMDRPADYLNPANASSNKIPFGLNDENKIRLARLNRNEQRNELPTTRYNDYRTEMGDTLSKLSIKFYGNPDYYLDIYLANRDQLRNPADVPAGIILKIPVYD